MIDHHDSTTTAVGSAGSTATAATTTTAVGTEDAKLITLARGARGRAAAPEGAAVRDTDGRTYAAATVTLKSFQLTAVQAAVAAAVASGADELEAVAVVGAFGPGASADPASMSAARDLAAPVLILASPDGNVLQRLAP